MALSICVYTPVTVGAFQRLEERDHIEDNGHACSAVGLSAAHCWSIGHSVR